MKHGYLWAGFLGLWVASTSAVEFNTDALKKMQQEGHKILEDQQGPRVFRLGNGNCLQPAGDAAKPGTNVALRKCDDKVKAQQWTWDSNGRLLSQAGTCLSKAGEPNQLQANAVLRACTGAKNQQWEQDGEGRLINGVGSCLQAEKGNAVTRTCNQAPTQKWS